MGEKFSPEHKLDEDFKVGLSERQIAKLESEGERDLEYKFEGAAYPEIFKGELEITLEDLPKVRARIMGREIGFDNRPLIRLKDVMEIINNEGLYPREVVSWFRERFLGDKKAGAEKNGELFKVMKDEAVACTGTEEEYRNIKSLSVDKLTSAGSKGHLLIECPPDFLYWKSNSGDSYLRSMMVKGEKMQLQFRGTEDAAARCGVDLNLPETWKTALESEMQNKLRKKE